jgi:hypothetical protein
MAKGQMGTIDRTNAAFLYDTVWLNPLARSVQHPPQLIIWFPIHVESLEVDHAHEPFGELPREHT